MIVHDFELMIVVILKNSQFLEISKLEPEISSYVSKSKSYA